MCCPFDCIDAIDANDRAGTGGTSLTGDGPRVSA